MRMSPERPPSQDSGGGGGVGVVGISNGSSSVITQVIEPQNMVLSTLSPETSHVITTVSQSGQQHRIITANHQHQQQQQQQHQTQQIIVNGNSYTAIHSSNSPPNSTNNSTVAGVHHHRLKAASFTSAINGNNANTSPPKYVVFHQNGTSQPTTYIATAQQPAQHQSNGVGNIVVLATEPLDTTNHHHVRRISTAGGNPNGPNHNNTNSGTTDEDLTPLSWLHDKNLINNIVSYSSNGKSVTASPVRQSNNVSNNNNGPLSPTSDFLEDSCVSEDNTSSVNSSSDQGISIHSSDFSPTTTASNSSFVGVHHHNHHHQQQQHQQQLQVTQYQQNGYSVHHHIQYTNGNSTSNNNNNNNNSTIKNRNHILSPSSSSSSTSSQIGVQDSNIITSTGPTTTLHVGPSGTTTVVEYKAGTNFIPASRCQIPSSSSSSQQSQSQQHILPSSPQRTTPPSATNTVYVHHTNATTNHQVTPTSSTTTTSSISTTTKTYHQQHFHKKYLREQMNGFDQNNFNNNDNTANNVMNRTTVNVVTSDNRDQASPIASPNSHQNSKLTTTDQPLSAGDIKEYHYSPIKTVPTTVSYSATNESQDDLIKEGINFDSQQNGVGSSSSKMPSSKQTAASPKQKQSTNSPYDPRVHTHTKPPYSFSSLIFMAIEDSPEKALPVKEIYAWIVQHFPYFKTAPTGWKNSVRHNLSLNKSFLKVEKAPNMGKGSLWRVEQNQRPNLIQALTRSPFFPRTLIDKVSPQLKSPISNSNNRGSSNVNNSINPIIEDDSSADRAPLKSLDAKLFPKLSKMIKEMVNKGNYTSNNQNSIGSGSDSAIEQDESHYDNQQQQIITYNGVGSGGVLISNGDVCCNSNGMMVPTYEAIERLARDCGADNDDVNAAAAMLALKHGPKVFSETFANGSPVITSSPSEDHTYSAGNGGSSTGNNSINPSENNSNCNSSDGAYDSREGSPVHHYHQYHHHHHHNDQQQQQHQENVGYHQIVTAEELEEQRRHAEGVDALLSFASKVSSMTSSGASSPVKRPSSTSPSVTEDEHISYAENIPTAYTTITTMNDDVESPPIMNGIVVGGGGRGVIAQHQQHTITGPGQTTTTVMIATAAAAASAALPSSSSSTQKHTTTFNSDGYYNHLLSPTPAKKLKTSRNLRTKIKRKATWIR